MRSWQIGQHTARTRTAARQAASSWAPEAGAPSPVCTTAPCYNHAFTVQALGLRPHRHAARLFRYRLRRHTHLASGILHSFVSALARDVRLSCCAEPRPSPLHRRICSTPLRFTSHHGLTHSCSRFPPALFPPPPPPRSPPPLRPPLCLLPLRGMESNGQLRPEGTSRDRFGQ